MKNFLWFVVGIMISTTITTFALNCDDIVSCYITDHDQLADWNKDAVEELYVDGVLTGYSDGRFMPNKQVTRGEVAVLLKRMKDLLLNEFQDNKSVVTILPSINDEGLEYLISRIDAIEDSIKELEQFLDVSQEELSYSDDISIYMQDSLNNELIVTDPKETTELIGPIEVKFASSNIEIDDSYIRVEDEWDFGDESSPEYGQIVSHIYEDVGVYEVSLAITVKSSTTGELITLGTFNKTVSVIK